ncbi:ATP-binding protein [Streptomyces sp. NPDC001212]
MVQLLVSELVTNAPKYAPGPCMLTLEATGGAVGVTVWDSEPTLPTARAADPGRVGRHGLEIVLAVSEGFTAQPAVSWSSASPPADGPAGSTVGQLRPTDLRGRRTVRPWPTPVCARDRLTPTMAVPASAADPSTPDQAVWLTWVRALSREELLWALTVFAYPRGADLRARDGLLNDAPACQISAAGSTGWTSAPWLRLSWPMVRPWTWPVTSVLSHVTRTAYTFSR